MYEITKKDGKFKLQMPKGILAYRTKRAAKAVAEACMAADRANGIERFYPATGRPEFSNAKLGAR